MPLRGGGGGPLMANAILNFHFDYLTPSLIRFLMKSIRTQHYTGRRTIGTSAFFQTIVKDFQGLKTSKEIKIPQKYLDRKDNFWSKMHWRGVTTYPVYRKLKWLTYAKKCKPTPTCSPPTITHYNLHNKMMTKTLLWTFLIFVRSVYVFLPFPPPLLRISHHFTSILSSKT